jgi:hypothetical protein
MYQYTKYGGVVPPPCLYLRSHTTALSPPSCSLSSIHPQNRCAAAHPSRCGIAMPPLCRTSPTSPGRCRSPLHAHPPRHPPPPLHPTLTPPPLIRRTSLVLSLLPVWEDHLDLLRAPSAEKGVRRKPSSSSTVTIHRCRRGCAARPGGAAASPS